MKLNKDSNSINGFNKRIAFYQQTKKKMKQFSIIISILKTIKLNIELSLHKNGNQIQQKVLNFLNFYFLHWILGEQSILQMLF